VDYVKAGRYGLNLQFVIFDEEFADGHGAGVVVSMLPGEKIRLYGQDAEVYRKGLDDARRKQAAGAVEVPNLILQPPDDPPSASSVARRKRKPRA
jgi:hypothetical protein